MIEERDLVQIIRRLISSGEIVAEFGRQREVSTSRSIALWDTDKAEALSLIEPFRAAA